MGDFMIETLALRLTVHPASMNGCNAILLLSPAAGIASRRENFRPSPGMKEDTCFIDANTSWEGPAKHPSSAKPGAMSSAGFGWSTGAI
jgi:hypothetical protein